MVVYYISDDVTMEDALVVRLFGDKVEGFESPQLEFINMQVTYMITQQQSWKLRECRKLESYRGRMEGSKEEEEEQQQHKKKQEQEQEQERGSSSSRSRSIARNHGRAR